MIYFGKGMMMRFVVGKEGCVVEVREARLGLGLGLGSGSGLGLGFRLGLGSS